MRLFGAVAGLWLKFPRGDGPPMDPGQERSQKRRGAPGRCPISSLGPGPPSGMLGPGPIGSVGLLKGPLPKGSGLGLRSAFGRQCLSGKHFASRQSGPALQIPGSNLLPASPEQTASGRCIALAMEHQGQSKEAMGVAVCPPGRGKLGLPLKLMQVPEQLVGIPPAAPRFQKGHPGPKPLPGKDHATEGEQRPGLCNDDPGLKFGTLAATLGQAATLGRAAPRRPLLQHEAMIRPPNRLRPVKGDKGKLRTTLPFVNRPLEAMPFRPFWGDSNHGGGGGTGGVQPADRQGVPALLPVLHIAAMPAIP